VTIFRNVAIGHTPSESFSFTLHTYSVAGTVSDALAAFHTAVGLLWNGAATPADSIKQCVSTTVGIDEVTTTSLDVLTGKNVTRLIQAESLVGTNATATLPPQDSIVVSLRTILATRAGRGRFYLPPFCTDQTTAGGLSATPRGQVAQAATGFLQSLVGSGFVPVIYHRVSRTHDNIISVDVGSVFDNQRRRRNKLVETRTSHTL
jgi:hypothetical protein